MSLQTKHDGVERSGELSRRPYLPIALAGLVLCYSGSLSLMVTLFLLGRAYPLQATRSWLAIVTAIFLVVLAQQLRGVLRLLRLRPDQRDELMGSMLPWLLVAFATTTIVDVSFYVSDDVNFRYVNNWLFLVLLAGLSTLLLYGALLAPSLFPAPKDGLGMLPGAITIRQRLNSPAVALLILGFVGLLQGTSFITVLGDDYSRYWTIADALAGGWGYPVSEVAPVYQAGGMSRYLVDLPALPLAMMLSFSIIGHNVLAAMMPPLIAGSLFCLVAYLALRELTGHVGLSYVVAAGLAMFPLFTFYVLRAAEPDGMFVTLLVALAFLALRADKRPGSRWTWGGLGLVAGAVALTRPEGIMYSGVTLATLALAHRTSHGYRLAAILWGCIVALFSITMLLSFGVPWPSSFVGTVQPEHVIRNLEGLETWGIPRYADAQGIPPPLRVLLGSGLTKHNVLGSRQQVK
ncbi:MAG: glycosyltransferase family 39 protein, partial [Chloroflexota bacterium]